MDKKIVMEAIEREYQRQQEFGMEPGLEDLIHVFQELAKSKPVGPMDDSYCTECGRIYYNCVCTHEDL